MTRTREHARAMKKSRWSVARKNVYGDTAKTVRPARQPNLWIRRVVPWIFYAAMGLIQFSSASYRKWKSPGHQAIRSSQLATKQQLGRPNASGSGVQIERVDAAMADAVSALVNLGYRRPQAKSAIAHAALTVGEAPGVERLIKSGLRLLAKSGKTSSS